VTGGLVARHPAFAAVAGPGAGLERVVATDAHEGAVYRAADHALYFTTVPSAGVNAVARLSLGAEPVVRDVLRPAAAANGMALAADGRLLVCEQGGPDAPGRIAVLDPGTGAATTLVDGCGGLPLNSPNDVAVAADGGVWFTDPSYGHLQGFRPPPALPDRVYRWRDGDLAVVADDVDKPNGLAFSADGSVLYLTDTGRPSHVRALDVVGGERAGSRVLAALPGNPDGIAVDGDGRVYVCVADGVQVLDPTGEWLGTIRVPGAVSCCFGGRGRDVLFVLADTAVWAATLHATG
jgi:gluconolactonase